MDLWLNRSDIVHVSDLIHRVICGDVHRREAAGDLKEVEVADEVDLHHKRRFQLILPVE